MVGYAPHRDLNERLIWDLVDAVKAVLRKEASDRLRDVYMVGDIEKDPARAVIERVRELANDSTRPITVYINSAGGNVTDGLAIHDTIRQIVRRGIEVTIVEWAGWQSTSAAAPHLDRLKQMQAQIDRILAARSGKPLQKIIRDTKRTDFYLDAQKALAYGLIDAIVEG